MHRTIQACKPRISTSKLRPFILFFSFTSIYLHIISVVNLTPKPIGHPGISYLDSISVKTMFEKEKEMYDFIVAALLERKESVLIHCFVGCKVGAINTKRGVNSKKFHCASSHVVTNVTCSTIAGCRCRCHYLSDAIS